MSTTSPLVIHIFCKAKLVNVNPVMLYWLQSGVGVIVGVGVMVGVLVMVEVGNIAVTPLVHPSSNVKLTV